MDSIMKDTAEVSLFRVLQDCESKSPNLLAQAIFRNLRLHELSLTEKIYVVHNCFFVLDKVRIVEEASIIRAALEIIASTIFSDMCNRNEPVNRQEDTDIAKDSSLSIDKAKVTLGTCIMCQGVNMEIRRPKRRLRQMLENSKYKDYSRMKLCAECKGKLKEIVMHIQDATPDNATQNRPQASTFAIEQAEGLFGAFGYHVGISGLNDEIQRDAILQNMLNDTRASINGISLKGAPNTAHRFRQIVRALDFQIATKESRAVQTKVFSLQRDGVNIVEFIAETDGDELGLKVEDTESPHKPGNSVYRLTSSLKPIA